MYIHQYLQLNSNISTLSTKSSIKFENNIFKDYKSYYGEDYLFNLITLTYYYF